MIDALKSYERLSKTPLIPTLNLENPAAGALIFKGDYYLIMHNTEDVPRFNYGNRRILDIFEVTWEELMVFPGYKSAPPEEQADREAVMRTVEKHDIATGYTGTRISSTGKRFLIKHGAVWNVRTEHGEYIGRAAFFKDIEFL